jgi:hypothetical protein
LTTYVGRLHRTASGLDAHNRCSTKITDLENDTQSTALLLRRSIRSGQGLKSASRVVGALCAAFDR